jgi:hypothetical protein
LKICDRTIRTNTQYGSEITTCRLIPPHSGHSHYFIGNQTSILLPCDPTRVGIFSILHRYPESPKDLPIIRASSWFLFSENFIIAPSGKLVGALMSKLVTSEPIRLAKLRAVASARRDPYE